MEEEKLSKGEVQSEKIVVRSAKECAYVAVFVALVVAAQFALSFVPGVEIVTLLFVTYSFVFGVKRGVVAAVVFSVLRQVVFGFYPTVLITYLIYYPLLALSFGALGHVIKSPLKFLALIVLIACVLSVCFIMLDNLITPLWYGLDKDATKLYFSSSLPLIAPTLICTAGSLTLLFLPLLKVFGIIKARL